MCIWMPFVSTVRCFISLTVLPRWLTAHGSATISLDSYFRASASAPVVRGEREDLFLRIGQVLDAAGQQALGRADHVQRLPHPLDQAVLGHETGGKHVMEGAPGRLRR